ncbi:MAG TPA: hypothetical protein VER55_07875 [Ardenticatenaceae bacterium]|nr:hypothetical protein [Ardenticatenaceae bacterium]
MSTIGELVGDVTVLQRDREQLGGEVEEGARGIVRRDQGAMA